MIFTGGASIVNSSNNQVMAFQTALLQTQIALENAFYTIASSSAKCSFILCDRGSCDGRAYMTKEQWDTMLGQNSWDMVKLRDERYDLVVHLVSAADGAADFYTLENNQARSESIPEALRQDRRTQKAWVGHPHLCIVDNRTGFREKIDRVFSRIADLAGMRISKRVVRKFLVMSATVKRSVDSIAGVEDFKVEQTFLKRGPSAPDAQESVRLRGKHSVYTFVHKVRKDNRETKRQITNREYLSLLAHSDPERRTVRIRRQCFIHEGNYFVMDTVTNVAPEVRLVRCHCEESEASELQLPVWLIVEKEVTGEAEWSMYAMSKRITKERIHTHAKPIPEPNPGLQPTSDVSFAKSF